MLQPVTKQELIDASADALTLEQVVNGTDTLDVTSRLARTYPTLAKALRLIVENGLLGATPFNLGSQMIASSLVDGDYAVVTDDPTPANNGFYQKQSGVFEFLAWNPLAQANAYADANPLFKPVVLAAAADFNALTVEGRTVVPTNAIAAACTNRPSATAGVLDVALIGGSGVFQTYRVFQFDLAYERQRLSGGTWTDWVQSASKDMVDTTAANTLQGAKDYADANALFKPVVLTTGADLNTLPTGYNTISADSIAATLIGFPTAFLAPRRGMVFTYRAGVVSYQKIVSASSTANEAYERTGNGQVFDNPSFAWNPWQRVIDNSVFNTALALKLDATVAATKLNITAASAKNLFTDAEIKGRDFSRISATASRQYLSRQNDQIVISAPAGTLELRWRFSAGDFANGKIGAAVRIISSTAGGGAIASGVVLRVWQTTITGSTLTFNSTTIANESAISSPISGGLADIDLNPSAVFVEIGLSLSSTNARTLVIDRLCLNSAGLPDFAPELAEQMNVFPDPFFVANNASTFNLSSVKNVGSELIATLTPALSNQLVVYNIPATGRFAPASKLRAGAEMFCNNLDFSIALIFYNAAGVEISRVSQGARIANQYDVLSVETAVPALAATVTLRIYKGSTAETALFKNVFVYSSNQDKNGIVQTNPLITLHIDTVNGADDNNGSINQPLKTFAKALTLAGKNTRFIVSEGDYFESPQMPATIQHLDVVARPNNRVRLFGGTKITGATKTAGRSKVWQIPFGAVGGRWLHQHGTPDADTLIDIADRRKWHNGKTYRLPDFTRIWQVASIAAIDAASKPSWFADGTTLYFSVVGGGDPTGIDIYIPSSTASLFYGAGINKNQSIRLIGIDAYHYLHGFRTWDMSSVVLERCKAFGCAGNGLEHSDSTSVRIIACEFGANSNDGSGAHVNRTNTHNISITYDAQDSWYHDNGDDGQSIHEMCSGAETNSLFEYNGDRGVATAVGAHTLHNGCESRKNGQGVVWGITIDDGAGFACVGSAVDGGVSTDMQLVNCVSEGNLVNYNLATTDAGTSVATYRAINCKSINPTTTHYNASGTRNLMALIDCGSFGAGTVKAGNATITVQNTTLVV